MSEHHTDPGTGSGVDPKAAQNAAEAQAKQQAAKAEADAKQAAKRAEEVDEASKEHSGKPAPKAEAKPKAEKTEAKEVKVVEKKIAPKQKPELDEATAAALALRDEKSAKRPAFRRQEWWRYKKLGGKNAGWRRPRGTHSKMRRHYKYRPNVVSIGYRGPAAARGLHPSGFQEVLVHRPEDLDGVDPKTQAARVGGTVGGRKAEMIEKEADKRGIRVLNRRS